jgi:RNA-directed DNA polymerase
MSAKHSAARNLAAAFLSGPWSMESLVRRGSRACGNKERWLRALARSVLRVFNASRPDEATLTKHIEQNRDFDAYWEARGQQDPLLRQLFWAIPTMAPSPWPVPAFATTSALAEWLGLTPAELDWFADRHGFEARLPAGPLRHYTYHWLAGRSGKLRLLEKPKQRLKAIQRRLLHEVLDRIPPHDAAHGYRPGRSLLTFVTPHCSRRLVLRFDLRDFFPSVPRGRVHALFRTAGYPPDVARVLAALCTNVVPREVWNASPLAAVDPNDWARRQHYRSPHLPQGAPTSPALANLCAYRLDCRLAALARSAGAGYTRYADDLAFSGDATLERSARRFQVHVCRIALEEGFEVNTRKSRFMRPAVRQQLAGVVLNARPNVRRGDYDRLKAILCNCVRHGPASQNRDGHADFRAHLAGRIAHVALLNPRRGERLRTLFGRINWPEGEGANS